MVNATPIKLAISICSHRPMPVMPALSLAMMTGYLTHYNIPFALLGDTQASLLPQARQNCLDMALRDGCTHQLWLDDDIECAPDAVIRLLKGMEWQPAPEISPGSEKRIDVVGANYQRKEDPVRWTALDKEYRELSSEGKTGIQEVSSMGMGLMLVRLDAIRKTWNMGVVRTDVPFFETLWDELHNCYIGEDRYFCERLRHNDIKLYVDHDVSNTIKHWGCKGWGVK